MIGCGATASGALIALALALAPGAAQAQTPRITAALGGDAKALLVGRSAELYRSVGEAAWKRDGAGGVSVDVQGLIEIDGTLHAVGRRTPLFVRMDGLWYASPLPNRGRVALSAGAPLISIDRHVYQHDGARWKRVISARSTITAIWAASGREFYVATEEGSLARSDGRGWKAIHSPLPAEDPIVRMIGRGKEVLAVAQSHAIVKISGTRASVLTPPAGATGLEVSAVGVVAGRPVVAARLPRASPDSATARTLLLRADGGAAKVWLDLEIPAGDAARVLLDAGGEPVVVSGRGKVFRRRGDSWSAGTLAPDPPAAPTDAGPQRGPARSR